MTLADFLPADERQRRFAEAFSPGVVLRLRCPFLPIHYDKKLLVVCTEPRPILLFINSEILEMYERRPSHKARQLSISVVEYGDFLTCDSYVDCTTPVMKLSRQDIKESVTGDMSRILGRINNETLKDVLKQVSAADMMEYPKKQWIVTALRSALELGE